MADKTIGSLPAAAALDDDSLLIAEQRGEAVHFRGRLLKDYARQGVDALVADAQAAAERAEQAALQAEEAVEGIRDVTADVEAAEAAARAAESARDAANQAATAAEQAAQLAAQQAAESVEQQLAEYVNDAEDAKNAAQSAAGSAAQDAVNAVDTELAGYVAAAQAAQRAAEQARDEAQNIAGGDFASTSYVDQKAKSAEDNAKAYTDEKISNIDVDVTADEVKFSDGETFQQKYDNGELTGPPGEPGQSGGKGDPGAPATINGVNVLTIEVDENLTITQTGSVLRIGLGKVPETSKSAVVTLSASGWTEQSNGRYTQTVAVDFMTADAPVVSQDVYMSGADPDADDTMEAAYLGNIYRMTQGAGTVTFWARSVPEVNIQVSVGVS